MEVLPPPRPVSVQSLARKPKEVLAEELVQVRAKKLRVLLSMCVCVCSGVCMCTCV